MVNAAAPLWILTLCFLSIVKSSRILGVFPSPGYSQFILGEKLMCELVKRGHDVTIISPYKPESCMEKCRTVLTGGLVDLVKGADLFHQYSDTVFAATTSIHSLGFLLTEHTLANEGVQSLLHSNATFDLVIVEKFVNEAHMAFAKHFNAPLILFSSNGPQEWTHASVGNINLPSIMPVSQGPFTTSMNFYQRLKSTIYSAFDKLYWHSVVLPRQREFVHKYFPSKIDLDDVLYNVSLVLLNSDVSTTEAFSLVKNMVEVGGFHVQPKPLDKDLKAFLDNATDGVIFFSMGSNLNSTNFPEDKFEAIVKVFSNLQQKVIWKLEDTMKNKPSNLLIGKWLPQSDILGHPNVQLFISHAGLLSTTESVYYGVPMICIPIFGDQHMNTARIVKHGFGIRLSFEDINEESFEGAIKEVLENPLYKIQAMKRSNILRDQIARPMERAMFWIEYVLRHQGAPHLRVVSADLYWFQLYLLDVVLAVISVVYLLHVIIRYAVRKLSTNRAKSINTKPVSKKKRKRQ